jgi:hypothetical protein
MIETTAQHFHIDIYAAVPNGQVKYKGRLGDEHGEPQRFPDYGAAKARTYDFPGRMRTFMQIAACSGQCEPARGH